MVVHGWGLSCSCAYVMLCIAAPIISYSHGNLLETAQAYRPKDLPWSDSLIRLRDLKTSQTEDDQQKSTAMEILQTYISHHDRRVVEVDPTICSSKFVLVSYPELDSLGNNMYAFLNGYMLAVLLNRTVVIAAPHAAVPFPTPPWESDWMVPLTDLKAVWKDRRCKPALDPVIIGNPTKIDIFSCCGEIIYDHVMVTQCLNHHQLFQMSSPHATLSQSVRAIANGLFGLDEYTLYGLLLRSALRMAPPGPLVTRALDRLALKPTGQRPLLIGLHLRHLDISGDRIQADIARAKKSLEMIIAEFDPKGKRSCAVLLAANRPEVFDMEHFRLVGCKLVHVERPPSYNLGEKKTSEHGFWANSDIEIDDVNLLGFADIFIGSNVHKMAHSTFSMLIADMIAGRGGGRNKNIFWINDIVGNSSVPWNSNLQGSSSFGQWFTTTDCEGIQQSCTHFTPECFRHKAILEMQHVHFSSK